MTDWLYSIDASAFHFINQGLATSFGDLFWPYITDFDKRLPIRIILIAVWLVLIVKGGTRARTAALLVIPLLVLSDQLSSSIIKPLVGRLRPCEVFSPEQIHLLVGCGSGKAFPSSHAVNNFAVATMFSHYFPKAKHGLYAWATLIALSRVFVGVHYPADILGGAIIGFIVGMLVVQAWRILSQKYFLQLQ
jgi:undecaprenyl-diphosphatase